MTQAIRLRTFNERVRVAGARSIAGLAMVAIFGATGAKIFAGSIDGASASMRSESNLPNGTVMCMNRNPPDGTVIIKSVRQSSCGDQCESEVQIPAGHRMVICRGQAIPQGYVLELLATTPDCSCYGSNENAYVIKAEPEDEEFRRYFPR